MSKNSRYSVADFNEINGVSCPCGVARRAFSELEHYPLTIHKTDISVDARVHYHKKLTETYYILRCGQRAQMQLDDELIDLRPGMCIVIPPEVRHRAIGEMEILNIVTPKFDPSDEHFDD